MCWLCEAACWPNGQGKGLDLGLGLGLEPGNALLFILVLQNVMNIFVFIGSVASYGGYLNNVTHYLTQEVVHVLE